LIVCFRHWRDMRQDRSLALVGPDNEPLIVGADNEPLVESVIAEKFIKD